MSTRATLIGVSRPPECDDVQEVRASLFCVKFIPSHLTIFLRKINAHQSPTRMNDAVAKEEEEEEAAKEGEEEDADAKEEDAAKEE
mmetsp:Transcript_58366/g.123801  ORF Transcript_58366/g.123801 Transcript_58366/m.123801 type:complete len:86 (+) Transcript_58366:103-360(+)